MLSSEQIGTLVTALGAGIGTELDLEKLRYHKIVIMTDADVDGSHIRALLLTFFYRHMPHIIEKGYLHIAQPPLFRVRRGNNEKYIKDQKLLTNFLLNEGIKDINIELNNQKIPEKRLEELLKSIVDFNNIIKSLPEKSYPQIIEVLAAYNMLNDEIFKLSNYDKIVKMISDNLQSQQYKWTIDITEGKAIEFSRLVRGIKETYTISSDHIKSRDFVALNDIGSQIKELFLNEAKLLVKNNILQIPMPVQLLRTVLDHGQKGYAIQRFKGLGEMNADQLWDTTLNKENRILLQVSVTDAHEADEIVSTLMGNVVEPRRDFINANALKVANLDI